MSRRLSAFVVALAIIAPLSVTAACSSDKKDGSTQTETTVGGSSNTTSPEELIVSDAEVAAGIAKIDDQIALVLTTLPIDQSNAKVLVDQTYDLWYGIEGTIKQNSTDLYLDMEDGLGGVKNGVDQTDLEKAEMGSTAFSAAASKYLQQWPGTGSSTTTTKAP